MKIDTNKRLMEFYILLHGEKEITIANVLGYKIHKDDENTYFSYSDFITTKPWINEIVKKISYIIVKDNQFVIPNKLLKTVLPILLK